MSTSLFSYLCLQATWRASRFFLYEKLRTSPASPSNTPLSTPLEPLPCTLPQSYSQTTLAGHGYRWPSDTFATIDFLSLLSLLLLPKYSSDLLQHCSYPPACNWGSCVSSLVKISPPVELNCSICKGTSLPKLMIYSRLYLDQIWAILLGFGPLCLELGHFA